MGEKGLFSTGADTHTAPYPLLGLPDAAPPAAAPVKRTTSRQSSFASLHKYKSSDGNMMEVLAKGLGDEGEQLNLAMLNELAMLGGDAAGLGVEGGKADGGGRGGGGGGGGDRGVWLAPPSWGSSSRCAGRQCTGWRAAPCLELPSAELTCSSVYIDTCACVYIDACACLYIDTCAV